jgi:hypothetical protein
LEATCWLQGGKMLVGKTNMLVFRGNMLVPEARFSGGIFWKRRGTPPFL